MNLIAIQETPDVVQNVPSYRIDAVPPIYFGVGLCHIGDRGGFSESFTDSDKDEIVALTASDHKVGGHSVPAIGLMKYKFVYIPTGGGFLTSLVTARNSDLVGGWPNPLLLSLELPKQSAPPDSVLWGAIQTAQVAQSNCNGLQLAFPTTRIRANCIMNQTLAMQPTPVMASQSLARYQLVAGKNVSLELIDKHCPPGC